MKLSFTKILLFLFASLFVFSANTFASPSADLSNLLNSVHTMQAKFVQTVMDNKGKKIQEITGQMALERPGKFRWQIFKPIPQLVIANETKLWIYDPDLEQVTIRSLTKAAGETPALLLSHTNASLDADFTVTDLATKQSSGKSFALKPKKADSMFASIELVFANNQIKQMVLKDHLGHTTSITFENVQANTKLAASLFTFTPPKNVDVINEMRKK